MRPAELVVLLITKSERVTLFVLQSLPTEEIAVSFHSHSPPEFSPQNIVFQPTLGIWGFEMPVPDSQDHESVSIQ